MATPGYWEKPFGDGMICAYRSTDPNGTGMFLKIDEMDDSQYNRAANVRGYQGMSDIDTGFAPFPDMTQVDNSRNDRIQYWLRPSEMQYTHRWHVVADSRFIILLLDSYRENGYGPYVFGDIVDTGPGDDLGCVIAAQGRLSTQNFSYNYLFNVEGDGAGTGNYFAAKADGTLPPPEFVLHGMAGLPTLYSNSTGLGFPSPVSGGFVFYPITASDRTDIRGTVPGLLQCCTRPDASHELQPDEHWRILDPGAGLERPILMAGVSGSAKVGHRMFGVDIQGPWR